jgi:hypothetical protein
MQPTFLPWAGYFNLMFQANDFVFLDDVQLEKQSWQTRNRLINGGQAHWIIAPVHHTHLSQTLSNTEIMDQIPWRKKLARGFAISYNRHPFFADAKEIIDTLVDAPDHKLAALNQRVIRFLAAKFEMKTRFHLASELEIGGERSDSLISFCKFFSAEEYLSPVGSANYLAEDDFANRSPARLRFQNFVPTPYKQRGCNSFHSHLSIVDIVANIGWDMTKIYVETGSI